MKHNITFIYILHSWNNKFLISHFSWLQMFNSIRRDVSYHICCIEFWGNSPWSGVKNLFYHTWFSEYFGEKYSYDNEEFQIIVFIFGYSIYSNWSKKKRRCISWDIWRRWGVILVEDYQLSWSLYLFCLF